MSGFGKSTDDYAIIPESASNPILSSEDTPGQYHFSVCLNTGEILSCIISAQTGTIDVFYRRNFGCPVGPSIIFRSGDELLMVGCSLWKGIQCMPYSQTSSNSKAVCEPLQESMYASDIISQGTSTILASGFGDTARLMSFQTDIPVSVDFRSDQFFRAATNMWLLKQYGVDRHQSMLVVSFVQSTIIFGLESNDNWGSLNLVDLSEFFGMETLQRTLAIENSIAGSYVIQVCPDCVVVFKSNCHREQAAGPLCVWKLSECENFLQQSPSIFLANILHDVIFAVDVANQVLMVFQVKIARGSAMINFIHSMKIEGDCCKKFSHSDSFQTHRGPAACSR